MKKILNSFTGGSSKYKDLDFISHEENFNMFPETLESNEHYTNKVLKSLTGSRTILSQLGGFCRGLYIASTSPLTSYNAGTPLLYGVYGAKVYRIYNDFSFDYIGDVADNSEPVSFAETSGVPAHLCISSSFNIYTINLETESSLVSVDVMELPKKAGELTSIRPTMITALNYRIICNDKDSDYFYYSELGKPNGVNNNYAFYKYMTRYTFMKKDGTLVTGDDNQYYPPSEGSYVEGTLATEDVWMGSLNYIKAEFRSDNIVAIKAMDDYLFVIGYSSYQVYRWQDNINTPFITSTKNSSIGCKAPHSVSAINNKLIFLGASSVGTNSIWVSDGQGIEKISSAWIEEQIESFTRTDDAFSFCYVDGKHTFYVISFPSADRTYCYDFDENEWHTRATRDINNEQKCWFPAFAIKYSNKIIMGAFNEDKLIYLDKNKYTDYNDKVIERSRTTGIIINNFKRIIIHSLELIINSGKTNVEKEYDEQMNGSTPEGFNPNVMLMTSADGGYTWVGEKWAKAGRIGEYNSRCIFRNIGRPQRIGFKVTMTDPAPFNISKAIIDYTECGR